MGTVTVRSVGAPTVDLSGVPTADLVSAVAAMRETRTGYFVFPGAGRAMVGQVRGELDRRKDDDPSGHGPLSKIGEALVFGWWDYSTCGAEQGVFVADEDRPVVRCATCRTEIAVDTDHKIGLDRKGRLVDLHATCTAAR